MEYDGYTQCPECDTYWPNGEECRNPACHPGLGEWRKRKVAYDAACDAYVESANHRARLAGAYINAMNIRDQWQRNNPFDTFAIA